MVKIIKTVLLVFCLFSTGCASFIDSSFGTSYYGFFDTAKTRESVRAKLGEPKECVVKVESDVTYYVDVFEVTGKIKRKTDGAPQLLWAVYTLGLSELVLIPATVASNISKLSKVNRLLVYYDETGNYRMHKLFDVDGNILLTGWY